MRMTSEQYRALGNTRKISKKNLSLMEKGKLPVRPEDDECIDFVKWLESCDDILYFSHIRSEAKVHSAFLGAYFQRLGVRKGLPDYFIITNDFQLILLEMKTTDGGIVSKEQQKLFLILKKIEDKISESGCRFHAINSRICDGYVCAKGFVMDCIFRHK